MILFGKKCIKNNRKNWQKIIIDNKEYCIEEEFKIQNNNNFISRNIINKFIYLIDIFERDTYKLEINLKMENIIK